MTLVYLKKRGYDADRYAYAVGKDIKGSVKKLSLIAQLVRGMSVGEALVQLRFCKRRAANTHFIDILKSAIANAGEKSINADHLFIAEVLVDKMPTMRTRYYPAGRGRTRGIQSKSSRITIIVGE